MNKDTLLTAGVGEILVLATGAATEVVTLPTPETVQTVGQLLIQLVIGIVTIWKLVKKPKKNDKI
jgi:hypothetical protein